MKNLNHHFEKLPSGKKTRLYAKARSHLFLLFVASSALFQFISCSKDNFEGIGRPDQTPLFSQGSATTATNLELSYDVVIKRKTTFQNGLGADAPGWKKIQSVPETTSYSLEVEVDNGSFYLLQDNILTYSHLEDELQPEDKVTKMEVLNSTLTTYDSLGNVISSLSVGNLSQDLLEDISTIGFNVPIDTNALIADSIPFHVSGNRLLTWTRIANGDEKNSMTCLDMNTGATVLEHLYDDNNASIIVSTASHAYSSAGILQSSKFTYYDYLSDGDVKRTDEQWDYSNFSLNLY